MKPPSDSDAILVFPSQGEGDCAHCAAPLYRSPFVTFKNDTTTPLTTASYPAAPTAPMPASSSQPTSKKQPAAGSIPDFA